VFEAGLADRPGPLRVVLLGGGPIPGILVEQSLARGIPAAPTYGLTEAASQVATLAPAELALAGHTAGRPLPDTEVRIARDDGTAAGIDEPGEILVRGPQVMRGYLDRPDDTARALAGGWLHTGDVGALDAAGRLRVLDRREDLIVSGGENVYPAEVENALFGHPAIGDVAVIGVPDDRWGEAVKAIVVLKPGLKATADEILAFARTRIAGYKLPKTIDFISELPRNPSGKVLKRELRKPFWEGRDRQVN
jgi:acyl-CoA synthetase (AMP-forming)/AMP-acid ligase II